jgi:hypothetical protein
MTSHLKAETGDTLQFAAVKIEVLLPVIEGGRTRGSTLIRG